MENGGETAPAVDEGATGAAAGPAGGSNKQILILSSAGKPIWARHGDDDDGLHTTVGVVQAVISFARRHGDEIRCLKAGARRVVFMVERDLYFVVVSGTGEPEAVLLLQLRYIYQQILFVLSAKVHQLFASKSGFDVRSLLGDAGTLIRRSCSSDVCSLEVALQAARCMPIDSELRSQVAAAVKTHCGNSGALYGLVLHRAELVALVQPRAAEHVLTLPDLLLLTDFVASSPSLRLADQTWLPLCLPNFNDGGFLQAYVAYLCRSPDIVLVLVSTANDVDQFQKFHASRTGLEEALSGGLMDRLRDAARRGTRFASRFISQVRCMHFCFKHTPRSASSPAVMVQSGYVFPLTEDTEQERVVVEYQRLALRLRAGSATAEATFPLSPRSPDVVTSGAAISHSFTYVTCDTEIFAAVASADSELYVTFPSTLEPVDTCGLATLLSRLLRQEVDSFAATTASTW